MKNTYLRVEKNAADMIQNLHSKVPWIQYVRNGNFTADYGWATYTTSNELYPISIQNGELTLTVQNAFVSKNVGAREFSGIQWKEGHYIAIFGSVYMSNFQPWQIGCLYGDVGAWATITPTGLTSNEWHNFRGIVQITHLTSATGTPAVCIFSTGGANHAAGDIIKYKNLMIFDLTEMYGAGNEPTNLDGFRAAYPLQYYETNIK